MEDATKTLSIKLFIMILSLLAFFIISLPVIVLFSGMIMSPLMIFFTLLILSQTPRGALSMPSLALANSRRVYLLYGAMLLLPLITCLWTITPAYSLRTASGIFLISLTGATCFIFSGMLPHARETTLSRYGFSYIVVSLLVLQEFVLGTHGLFHFIFTHLHLSYERFETKNINRGLCALVIMLWPLILGFYQAGKQKQAWAITALFAAAILSMHSLSAMVGLMASIVAFFALRRYPATVSWGIVIFFPCFLLSFPLLFKLLEEPLFGQSWVLAHLPGSSIHRLHIWHVLIDSVRERPWLGWGMDTTRNLPLSPASLDWLNLKGPPLHPHSPSIELLLEEGVIGWVLTIAGFTMLLREWRRTPMSNPLHRATSGALIVAYFATGLSSFGLWQHWWIATMWVAGMLWRWFGHTHTAPARQTAV